MEDKVLSERVTRRLEDFFERDIFYNPPLSLSEEMEIAVDSGVLLRLDVGDRKRNDDGNVVYDVKFHLYCQGDEFDGEQTDSNTLAETGEFGQQMQKEIIEFVNHRFGEYQDGSLTDFTYHGEWAEGHYYISYFRLREQQLTPGSAETVRIQIELEGEVSRNVPVEAIENDSVEKYLVEEWWSTRSKREKAAILGLTDETFAQRIEWDQLLRDEEVNFDVNY